MNGSGRVFDVGDTQAVFVPLRYAFKNPIPAGKRARAATADGEADFTEVQIPASLTGRCDRTRVSKCGSVGGGVGLVGWLTPVVF